MQFHTLENTTIKEVAEAFGKAFEGYAVSMQLSEEQMTGKIKAENIDLSMSVGAFDSGQLCGFILFGLDMVNGVKTMWDGGTGVLPEYRGQKLTQRMFEHILPAIKKNDVKRILLEVLEGNESAQRIYESLGFRTTRKLLVYNGSPKVVQPLKHNIEILTPYNPEELPAIGDWQPAWQQMNDRVAGWGDAITTIGIRDNEQMVAYAHFDASRKRVFQFGVAAQYRHTGMGTALFNYMAERCSPLSVVNVDEQLKDATSFLEGIGMEYFKSQYEMEYIV